MTGASGSFYSRVENYNLEGYLTLTVKWTQTCNPGDSYSTVTIEASLARDDSGNQAGGTWLANADGGIVVNGTQACGWIKSQSAGWTNPGQIGWSGNGSVKVNHNDAKTITIEIQSVTWNNQTYSSSSFTIPRKTQSVTLKAIPQAHTLSISAGTGSTVTVNRTDSPSGSTGALKHGATVYDGDVLKLTTSVALPYEITAQTVNGSSFVSGSNHTVSKDVSVITTTRMLGLAYIDSGTELERYLIYIDNGSDWDMYLPYIDNGSDWDMMS